MMPLNKVNPGPNVKSSEPDHGPDQTLKIAPTRNMVGRENIMEKIDRKFIFEALNPCNGNVYTAQNAFVLCAKDKAVPAALRAYLRECIDLGANVEHVKSIGLLIGRVERYQAEVESRVPDTIGACELARCLHGGSGL